MDSNVEGFPGVEERYRPICRLLLGDVGEDALQFARIAGFGDDLDIRRAGALVVVGELGEELFEGGGTVVGLRALDRAAKNREGSQGVPVKGPINWAASFGAESVALALNPEGLRKLRRYCNVTAS